MKFRIYFEVEDIEDFFEVEADTLDEMRDVAKREIDVRNLDVAKNNVWSEEIKS